MVVRTLGKKFYEVPGTFKLRTVHKVLSQYGSSTKHVQATLSREISTLRRRAVAVVLQLLKLSVDTRLMNP